MSGEEFFKLEPNRILGKKDTLEVSKFLAPFPVEKKDFEQRKKEAKELGVTAMDFAKRLLDLGYHAPTTYFPLLIPECLLRKNPVRWEWDPGPGIRYHQPSLSRCWKQ